MNRRTTAFILWAVVIMMMVIVMNINQNTKHKETLTEPNVIVK